MLHDLNIAAAFADRVLLLSAGRVAAEGPPEAVFRPDLLSAVYGAPVAVDRAADGGLRIVPALRARKGAGGREPAPASGVGRVVGA